MVDRLKMIKIFNDKGQGEKTLANDGTYRLVDSSYKYNQITKMNIEAPYTFSVNIIDTKDFNFPEINVLKFEERPPNTIITICDFNVEDTSQFESNDKIEFDGTLKLKRSNNFEVIKDSENLYHMAINKKDLQITNIEVI